MSQYSALNYNCIIRYYNDWEIFYFRIFFGMKLILIVALHECKAHVTRMFDVITPKVQTKTFASKF